MNVKKLVPGFAKRKIKEFIRAQVAAEIESKSSKSNKAIAELVQAESKKPAPKPIDPAKVKLPLVINDKNIGLMRPKITKLSAAETEYDFGNGNKIINLPKLENSKIIFNKKRCIFYCETDEIFRNSSISFSGENCLAYIAACKNGQHIGLNISGNCTLYIGKDTKFNMGKSVDFHLADNRNLIIGDDCLFSWNPWIFNQDGHPLYDQNTKKRINTSRSILIGDHVWIGEAVSILKGAVVGSGAIIGLGSILSKKPYYSNSCYVGNPARRIKENVFFTKQSLNELPQDAKYDDNEFIYRYIKGECQSLDEIDKKLATAKTAEKKLRYIKNNLVKARGKNRFYIGPENT